MFDFTEYKHNRYMLTLLDEGDGATGKLRKVRVNILDKNGECVEEVDVLTSADAVIFDNNRTLPQELAYQLSYTNSKPTTADVGGIKKGTTFVDVPFKDIIAALLYPEADADVSLTSNVEDKVYLQGTNISPITFTLDVKIGTNQIRSAKLFRDGVEEGTFKNFPASGGTGYYSYTGEVSSTTHFWAQIEDVKGGVIETETIAIRFEQPVYYGVLNEDFEITEAVIKNMSSTINAPDYAGCQKIITTEPLYPIEQHIVIAYPSYDTEVEEVINSTGLEVTNAFDKSHILITDTGGMLVDYTVWKLSHITTQNGMKLMVIINH